MLSVMKARIADQMKAGIIGPWNRLWSSPLDFKRLKDGKLRLLIDYRRLTGDNIADTYPLPRIADLIGSWELRTNLSTS